MKIDYIYRKFKDPIMEYNIRQETEQDSPAIYDLIKVAFETAKVSDGDEQDFATRLRNSELNIPELNLVAEEGDKLIGHIMFSKTYITQPDGNRFDVLLVAPLSVALDYRSKGIGAALMREGFKRSIEMGYKAAFLCGDPAYYYRLGFKSIRDFGITHKNIPEEYVMGYELIPGCLKGITGEVRVE